MRQLLIASAIAFTAGLGIGGLAFGQRDAALPGTVADPPLQVNADTPDPLSSAAAPEPVQPPGSAAVSTAADVPGEAPAEPGSTTGDPPGLVARWKALDARVERLSRRVVDLEAQLDAALPDPNEEDGAFEPLPIDTPDGRSNALVYAGVDPQVAEDIVWRESSLAMARLDLQDRAAREGWRDTDRYREEMNALDAQAVDLRAEVGDATYDRFLYETGQANRVAVSSVFAGSQGEQAGIRPGDIIEDYAGEPVFDFGDLRNATMAGERDEMVPVTIRRDGDVHETWIARGPIGVRLEADSAEPGG